MSNDSHDNLIETLRLAWERLDVDLIEPILADDLHYYSWWAMIEFHNKGEYLAYIKDRFQTFKDTRTRPLVKLGINKNDGEQAVAIQIGETAPILIRIKENHRMIKEMWMQPAE